MTVEEAIKTVNTLRNDIEDLSDQLIDSGSINTAVAVTMVTKLQELLAATVASVEN